MDCRCFRAIIHIVGISRKITPSNSFALHASILLLEFFRNFYYSHNKLFITYCRCLCTFKILETRFILCLHLMSFVFITIIMPLKLITISSFCCKNKSFMQNMTLKFMTLYECSILMLIIRTFNMTLIMLGKLTLLFIANLKREH